MGDVEELNCTQFLEPYPWPGSEDAHNFTFPWLIISVVKAYKPYHSYLYSSLIIFSVLANFSVIVVLSRKEMRCVGVNVLMMMIAGCDFFCSVWAVIQLILRAFDSYMSYFFGYVQILSDCLSSAFHASSLYLGVGMALCRVMSLNLSNKNRAQWQSPRYARIVAASLCTPVFLVASSILFVNHIEETEEDGIYLNVSELSLANGCLYMKFVLLLIGTCFKAVPCITMFILSMILLSRIEEGKKSSVSAASKQNDKSQKMDRSSRLIQLVLVIFLITELPQAGFSMAGGLFLIDYLNYYQSLVYIMNMLAFINTSTSFLVYSTLSAKFRKLFVQIFFPKSVTDKIYRKTTITVQSSSTRTI